MTATCREGSDDVKIRLAVVALVFCAASAFAGEFWHEAPEGVPGAVLVTSTERGTTSFECVGYADLAAKRKMTPDTVFWMASGGHGYGLRRVGNPTDAWSDHAAAWLKGLLK